MDPKSALDRVEDAADAAEAAATRLQQKTDDLKLDKQASLAKGTVHDVREAVEDLKEDLKENTSAENEAQAAQVAQAAAAVEAELKDIAAELAEASDDPADPNAGDASSKSLNRMPSTRTTAQAVKELELLAKVRRRRHARLH